MPEESIAAYINNIGTFAIFIVILVSLFAIIFLISTILARRNKKEEDAGIEKARKEIGCPGGVGNGNYRRDPYTEKNAFILGTLFVNVIIFLILIIAVFNYTSRPSINLNLYLIAGILFYLILMAIYLVKSKIIN
ncbi:MAG: hypothetical protein U9O59_07560 [Actinomycetota bacterium]|nr:hypothetical protein [Actinomycetota bacterium]